MNSCESCGSKEDLIESCGQFCGGDWWICKKCDDAAAWPLCITISCLENKLKGRNMEVKIKRWKTNTKQEPYRRGSTKKCEVILDKEDTWNMDFTVATIVAPLIKQLRETTHSYAAIDKEDVPQELHQTYGTQGEHTEKYSVQAYEWVLNEIEWAMNEISNENKNEPKMYKHVGDIEFGDIDEATGLGEIKSLGVERIPEMEEPNRQYHKRIQQGCVLFGKYFQNLWS